MIENKPLGAQIHMTANCIDNFISVFLAKNLPSNITAMEGMTLKFIYHAKRVVYAKDIMQFTKLSKATTSQTLTSMVKKGLIEMQEKEGDKRSKSIVLTPLGEKEFHAFSESFKKINEICESSFTPEEKEQLSKLLEKFRNNVTIDRNEVCYGKE
jgi:DNA-binding MarR family transcriptional regulator